MLLYCGMFLNNSLLVKNVISKLLSTEISIRQLKFPENNNFMNIGNLDLPSTIISQM